MLFRSKKLAYGGAVSLVVTVQKGSSEILGDPLISFQGVAGVENDFDLNRDAREAVLLSIDSMSNVQLKDRKLFQENIRVALKRFLQQEVGSKPVIVTTIVEV